MNAAKALYAGVKTGWILIAILILLVSLYGFDGRPDSDIGVFLSWSMLAISFPCSLLYSALMVGVAFVKENYFDSILYVSYFSLALDWTAFFLLGYLQWFKLVPYLWRTWNDRHK